MRVAILGTGLIGGSVGLALRARLPDTEVVVYDRDPASSARAIDRGAAHRATSSAAEAVEEADIVFIATPVGTIAGIAAAVGHALPADAVMTDVGSTKSGLVREIEANLPAGKTFVGGHPMAGSEDDGIDAAREDLFEGAWWILTPTGRSEAEPYRRLHSLLTALGARVMALDPQRHDQLLAVISHLPQLVATTLMNTAAEAGRGDAGLLALAAGGFRDVTRLAASNPEVWVDICRENSDAISEALLTFIQRLRVVQEAVASRRTEKVALELTSGREARRSLPIRGSTADPFEVRLPIPDRPGVLAEVTTSVGDIGINIEDLQIVHGAEGGRGVLHLLVSGEAEAARTAEALETRGFDAKVIKL